MTPTVVYSYTMLKHDVQPILINHYYIYHLSIIINKLYFLTQYIKLREKVSSVDKML